MKHTRKKIAIIGTAGVPARYGGFETLAHHLVENLNKQYAVSVYCSMKNYPKSEREKTWKYATLFYLPIKANGTSSILYDIITMLHALLYADVLLVLGVSGCVILPLIRLLTSRKIIVHIDGLEWHRVKWGRIARTFLKFSEKLGVKFADAVIADNMAIKDYILKEYKTVSFLITYGGDHASLKKPSESCLAKRPELEEFYGKNKGLYAMKVCRIEPENNIHLVLEAFSHRTEIPLLVIGNWKHSKYGLYLKDKYSECPNITLSDPVYNQNILGLLRRNSLLYIHGHSAGGTNPSLVEAMCAGLPVISFDVAYNRATTENKALFFKDRAELDNILKNTGSPDYVKIGMSLKKVAEQHYVWKKVSEKYHRLIQSLTDQTKNKSRRSEFRKANILF